MKKISYFLFGLFLLLYSNILPAADVVVTGIEIPAEMNGTYTVMGEYNSRPYFELNGDMVTYSLFYIDGWMLEGWMIFPDVGPYNTEIMWAPFSPFFYKSGNEMFPPVGDYSAYNYMGPSGDPQVNEVPAIPISLWGVVLVFVIAGSVLVIRYYRKRTKVA
jgi:hypothetical protein